MRTASPASRTPWGKSARRTIRLLSTIEIALCAFLFAVDFPHTDIPENEIVAVPSFNAVSIYFKGARSTDRLRVRYRRKGTDSWLEAPDLVYNPLDDLFRGSVAELREGTEYQVRITILRGKRAVCDRTCEFTTWSSSVRVARTLNAASFLKDGYLLVRDRGASEGWIRYTAPDDFIFKGPEKNEPAVLIENARYVILEGLRIQGGGRHAIRVRNSHFVRIVNCDISGWGREGRQDFTRQGKYIDEHGREINYDAGVYIDRSGRIVIERCYIHDPRGRANPWRYSHPAGPQAVLVRGLGGIVIRYNDFVGSDPHRWNDVIESVGNGSPTGGFYRDADVYGNFFAFGNDDGIELDGGQMNVRVHRNKFEGTLCGISTAPCLLGPSYSFRNLIVNLADEDGRSFSAVKNNYSRAGSGRVFFFNNTVRSRGSLGFSGYAESSAKGDLLKGFTRNNIFACDAFFARSVFNWKNDFDYDLFHSGRSDRDAREKKRLNRLGFETHGLFTKPEFSDPENGDFRVKSASAAVDAGTTVPGFVTSYRGKAPDLGAFELGDDAPLPFRPSPLRVFPQQMNFKVVPGKRPRPQKATVRLLSSAGAAVAFRVRWNSSFNWLQVKPDRGVLTPGKAAILTVTVKPDRMTRPKLYRGAFLVRLPDGFSRPVTVYADNHLHPFLKTEGEGTTIYIEAEKPVAPSPPPFEIANDPAASEGAYIFLNPEMGRDKFCEYAFDIPSDGVYLLFVRVRSKEPVERHDSILFSVDGSKPKRAELISSVNWTTALIRNVSGWTNIRPFHFKRGRHRVRILPSESIDLDLLIVTDDPKALYGY